MSSVLHNGCHLRKMGPVGKVPNFSQIKKLLKNPLFFPLLQNENLQEDKHSAYCFMFHSILEAIPPGSTRNSVIFHFTGAWEVWVTPHLPSSYLNCTALQISILILHFAEGNEVEEGWICFQPLLTVRPKKPWQQQGRLQGRKKTELHLIQQKQQNSIVFVLLQIINL